MIDREIQVSTATQPDRYPGVFQAAAELSQAVHGGRALKVLSFGCSTGDELVSLRAYFPDADLFGCDIKPEMVAAAAEATAGMATVFQSTPANLALHGPFDVIFAMSVFCLHGPDAGNIDTMFPFARFEESVAALAEHGAPDFVYVLYNSAYFFQETAACRAGFAEIRHCAIPENGFVNRYDPEQAMVSALGKGPDGRALHYLLAPPGRYPDRYFTTALFYRCPERAGQMIDMVRPPPRDLSCIEVTRTAVRGEAPVQAGHFSFPLITEERHYELGGSSFVQRTIRRRSVEDATRDYVHCIYDFEQDQPPPAARLVLP
jgi:hypothetical protein